jgi:protein SCO1/2
MRRSITAALALSLLAAPGAAQSFFKGSPGAVRSPESGLPEALKGVAYEQRLGEKVDKSLTLIDEQGSEVALGDLMSDRPAVLALVYYGCPMLCSLSMNGLASSLKAVDLDPGDTFDVFVVSFDPDDTPADAQRARERVLDLYDREGTEAGWHFLTAGPETIAALTGSVGFSYVEDPETGEFAHAAGIVLLTPEGKISRYLLGVEYASRDVRLGLIESADEQIGTLVDQVLLYCYRYDPASGTYSAWTMNLIRIAGAIVVAIMATFIVLMLKRDKKTKQILGETGHVA